MSLWFGASYSNPTKLQFPRVQNGSVAPVSEGHCAVKCEHRHGALDGWVGSSARVLAVLTMWLQVPSQQPSVLIQPANTSGLSTLIPAPILIITVTIVIIERFVCI